MVWRTAGNAMSVPTPRAWMVNPTLVNVTRNLEEWTEILHEVAVNLPSRLAEANMEGYTHNELLGVNTITDEKACFTNIHLWCIRYPPLVPWNLLSGLFAQPSTAEEWILIPQCWHMQEVGEKPRLSFHLPQSLRTSEALKRNLDGNLRGVVWAPFSWAGCSFCYLWRQKPCSKGISRSALSSQTILFIKHCVMGLERVPRSSLHPSFIHVPQGFPKVPDPHLSLFGKWVQHLKDELAREKHVLLIFVPEEGR